MSANYCQAKKYGMYDRDATCGEPVTGSHNGLDLCEVHLRRAYRDAMPHDGPPTFCPVCQGHHSMDEPHFSPGDGGRGERK